MKTRLQLVLLMWIHTQALALDVKGLKVDTAFRLQAPNGCAEIRSWHGEFTDIDGRKRSQMHRGLDIVAPKGAPVIAAAPGKVIYKDQQTAGGNSLMVWHGQDTHGNHVISYYTHLNEFKTEKDNIVKRGEVVGTLGDTGTNMPKSLTPHLHFEVLIYPDADLNYWFTGFLRGFTTVSPNYFSYPIPTIPDSTVTVPTHYAVWNKALDYGDDDWESAQSFKGFTFPLCCDEANK